MFGGALRLLHNAHEATMGEPFESSVGNSSDATVATTQTQVRHDSTETYSSRIGQQ